MHKNKSVFLITLLSIIPCVLYIALFYTDFNTYLYTTAAKLILFIGFPLIFCIITKKTTIKDIVSLRDKSALKIPAVLGLASALLIIGVYALMAGLFDSKQIIDGLSREGITKATYPFVFLYIVFINAFLEEFFFRGFLFLNLYRMGYKTFAYTYSGIMFSLYHTAMIDSWFSPFVFIIIMAGLFVAGLVLAEINRRFDNIYGGLLIHIGANIGINLIGAYLFYMS